MTQEPFKLNRQANVLYGNHGEHGDILIGLPGARHLFQRTGAKITICVNKKFHRIAPFLRDIEFIDGVYISDSYDQFPSPVDINYLTAIGFDHVCNPMQGHTRFDWYNYLHYTEENALTHGVLDVKDLFQFDRKIELKRFWGKQDVAAKTIAFSPYANGKDRAICREDAQFIVDFLKKNGFTVLMLGLEKDLEGVEYLKDNSLLNAGIQLAESAGVVTVDTVWSWLAGGYAKPTFGLYSKNYPDMVKQWSHFPPNPNAVYIVSPDIKTLDRAIIESSLTDWIKTL